MLLEADEEEKTSGSAKHWEERIDISRCAAPRGWACHPEKSSARSCWCKELQLMAMQVQAWQAGWDAKAAHFCPLWWADQNHERYPVATMVAKGRDHQDCRLEQWAHHIPLYYHRSQQVLDAPAAQRAAAPLPGHFPASHLWWLRFCNHLMGCCAAVSFPKSVTVLLHNLSNFMLRSLNDPLRWPHLPSRRIPFIFLYLDSSEKVTLHSAP